MARGDAIPEFPFPKRFLKVPCFASFDSVHPPFGVNYILLTLFRFSALSIYAHDVTLGSQRTSPPKNKIK